jgi:D-beta-D-heptose 7-phosphate kinase/D-beta-D-heptose 1-phosphate adenosyltransferase
MIEKSILVIGDVMLDRYIHGNATRISPEAPVPIVHVTNEYETVGGAGNVANNLVKLGVKNLLLGYKGKDSNGEMLLRVLTENNIDHSIYDYIPHTITKTRVISRNQQMIRIDREGNGANANINLEPIESILIHGNYQLFLVSDYAKGVCSDEMMGLILNMGKKRNIPVLIDPKGRSWGKYKGAYMIKPNLQELEDLVGNRIVNDDEPVAKIGQLVRKEYQIEYLVITRGDKGMTLISQDRVVHFPAKKVEVYDVSGAGDTSFAVIAMCILNGESIDQAIAMANLASSYVVTKSQTYAISRAELDSLRSDF